MSREALILLELYRRHMYAMRDDKLDERTRLFHLIDDFEWAFPNAKLEVEKAYPQDKKIEIR